MAFLNGDKLVVTAHNEIYALWLGADLS